MRRNEREWAYKRIKGIRNEREGKGGKGRRGEGKRGKVTSNSQHMGHNQTSLPLSLFYNFYA